jgi:type IV pilus assembly protein PilC
MVFAGGITVFMLVFIVPKFVSVYDSMGSDIPAITQFTLNLSAFLQNNWLLLILALVTIITAFIVSYQKVKAFRTFMQKFLMKMPVIGKLLISKEMSMFARTFASLQKNNVLLTDSIDILSKITSNEIYKELELRTIENLIKGNKMSDTFKNHWAIPDVAFFMIVTGESTGELAEMLDRVADFYTKELRCSN